MELKNTIRFKLSAIIAGLIIVMVVILGAFVYTYKNIDMTLVDLAGRQRMLLQKFAKEFFSDEVVPAQARHSSVKAAEDISIQIKEDRAKYTKSLMKVKQELGGFNPQRDWANVKGAMPLPATFVQEVSDTINKGGNYRYDLISKWNINKAKGLRTTFEREAFENLMQDSSKPYYKFQEYGGKFVLRHATADTASAQGCVSCHNSLADSPKRDFKIGDLMGILVVTVPVSEDIALGKEIFDIGTAEGAEKSYEKTAKVFEKTLNGLIGGGEVPLDLAMTQFKTIPPAENDAIRTKLQEVEGLWKKLLEQAAILKTAEVNSSEYLNGIKSFQEATSKSVGTMSQAVALISKAGDARLYNMVLLLISLMAVAIGLGIFGWAMISSMVVKPISKVVTIAQAISEGDLTAEDLDIKSRDEMGILGAALDKMKRNLNNTLGKIQKTSEHIATASAQLEATSTEIARGAETQSGQTNQVATAMEEMSATVAEVAKNSQDAAESSNAAQKVAENGGGVVDRTISGMLKVAETVRSGAATVDTLNQSSLQIGNIVSVINDIADQTNLLALNAAIEAARAGEQGRGFAVVADEVRSLAEKTTKATKEIAEMIKTIQEKTGGVMSSMQDGTVQVEEGVKLAGEAGEALKEIVATVNRASDMVRQIATSAEEQNMTTEEITANVGNIASVANKTVEDIRNISEATQNLSNIAVELKSIVDGFRIEKRGSGISSGSPRGNAGHEKKTDQTSRLKVVGMDN